MGQILSNPVIDKETESGSDKWTAYAVCAMQGWRMSMEDTHIAQLNLNDYESTVNVALTRQCDCHGGSYEAHFCGERR